MLLSGTSHAPLTLGQPVIGARLQQAAAPGAQQTGLKRKLSVAVRPAASNQSNDTSPNGAAPSSSAKNGGGGGKSGPSLADLIDAGLLSPGCEMSVTYKGNSYSGSLQGNGTIVFRGTTFSTPSAFSVHVKRLVTPNKQGDDGWHSVYASGVMLHSVRQRYHSANGTQPQTSGGGKQPKASKGSTPRKQQQAAAAAAAAAAAQQQHAAQVAHAQPPAAQQQGPRPPLPVTKLKLGLVKGLPGAPQAKAAQQHAAQPKPLQPVQQQAAPTKLRIKQPTLKLHLAPGAAGGGGGGGGGGGHAAPAGSTAAAAAAAVAAVAAAGSHAPPSPPSPKLAGLAGAPMPSLGFAGMDHEAGGSHAPRWLECSRCGAVAEATWPSSGQGEFMCDTCEAMDLLL